MIRRTKNTVLKIALSCLAFLVIFSLNGFGVYAEIPNLVQASDVQQDNKDESQINSEYLIDEPVKSYININKLKKHTRFNFKLPSSLACSKWTDENKYNLIELDNKSRAVIMQYDYNSDIPRKFDRHQTGMRLIISNGDPVQADIKMDEILDKYSKNVKYDIKESEKISGGKKGKDIVVDKISSIDNISGSVIRNKYFVWQEDAINYAIVYSYESFSVPDMNNLQNLRFILCGIYLDDNDLNQVVGSFKDVNSIKDIDYITLNEFKKDGDYYARPEISFIYDNDDLIEANELLKFKAKVPRDFSNKNIKIKQSTIQCTNEDKKEDRKYSLSLSYNKDLEEIEFLQSAYDSDVYDDCVEIMDKKEKGLAIPPEDSIFSNVESFDVDGIKVYKYRLIFAEDDNYIYYSWKDNGVYYKLSMIYTSGYEDDIAREFVTTKLVEEQN